jgi:4-amino-4-deoxy-L-arabinose transferase-like glycosyltransferase
MMTHEGVFFLVAVLSVLTFLGYEWSQAVKAPEVFFLLPEGGAQWIKQDEAFNLRSRPAGSDQIYFRKRFQTTRVPGKAFLTVKAFRAGEVWLNDRRVAEWKSFPDWKIPRVLDLGPYLEVGDSELKIGVFNQNAPPALLAFCSLLSLQTDPGWEASKDGIAWKKAVSVDSIQAPSLFRQFPRTDAALVSRLYQFLPIFFFFFGLAIFLQGLKGGPTWLSQKLFRASTIRCMVMAAWAYFAWESIRRAPFMIGFDWDRHMDYIFYVVNKMRVPMAHEGLQMFQPPLYYIFSGALDRLLLLFLSGDQALVGLRLIPLLAGAGLAECSYRLCRLVFPGREDLQGLGTILGGFLPMNLYHSQFISNESFAGCLSAASLILAYRISSERREGLRPWHLPLLGFFLGLALLSKMTAFLLLPSIFFFWLICLPRQGWTFRQMAWDMGQVLAVAFLVAGWYYLRNWMELGKPLIGGWDSARRIVWWQDPGYRTLGQLCSFGEALTYPLYSAVYGFWDSFYSTLWLDGLISGYAKVSPSLPRNFDLLLSGALLALLPSAGILLGILQSVFQARQWGGRLALVCLAVYVAAMLHLYVHLPIYSTAKASYTLGLTPCYAVLGTLGLDFLGKNPVLRGIIYGGVACWAWAAYGAYLGWP